MFGARKKIGGYTRQLEFTTLEILKTIRTTVGITSQINYMAIAKIKEILVQVMATRKKSG